MPDNNSLFSSFKPPFKLPEFTLLTFSQILVSALHYSLTAVNPKTSSFREYKIADTVPLKVCSSLSLIGPVLGASGSVLALETAIHGGAKQIVLFGTTGALKPSVNGTAVGHVIFPRAVFSEEGTSRLYDAKEYEPLPASNLQLQLEERIRSKWTDPASIHTGTIWTTDAPFRETIEKVERYSSQGVISVEMELAAVAALCRFHNLEMAAVLIVSDLLEDRWTPGFSKLKHSQELKLVCQSIAELAGQYMSN